MYILLLLALCAFTDFNLTGQTDLNQKPDDRVVSLKLIGHARDESGDYIFKMPHDILPIEDGCFFLIDNTQVLKFDSSCKFLKIIVSKGVGPKDAIYLNQLYRFENKLIVNTGLMGKLIILDMDGELIGEYTRSNKVKSDQKSFEIGHSSFEIIGHTKEMDFIIIDHRKNWDKDDVKKGLSREQVFLLSQKNELKKLLFEIPIKSKFLDSSFAKYAPASCSIINTHDTEKIYFSNTENYDIKVYDISANKTEANWERAYTPVPIPDNEKKKYNYGETLIVDYHGKSKKYESYAEKNFHDIQHLFIVNDKLWVITSTIKKEKGVLIDVFDKNGRYVDHFYLDLKGKLDLHKIDEIAILGANVYIREFDEEGNYLIAKYEMIGR